RRDLLHHAQRRATTARRRRVVRIVVVIGIARPLAVETDLTDRLIAGQDVRYAVKPIKTGLPFVDKMAIMEIIWYA
ncbi:hypothetical protein ACTXQV_58250, partial [Klebsiella pneumoniae]